MDSDGWVRLRNKSIRDLEQTLLDGITYIDHNQGINVPELARNLGTVLDKAMNGAFHLGYDARHQELIRDLKKILPYMGPKDKIEDKGL